MNRSDVKSARIIAIDGPAASGKTSIGKKIAQRLDYLFFDTGIMYRAVTWLAFERGIDLDDEAAVVELAETTSIDVRPASVEDGRNSDVLADGEDITWEIRRAEVDANVSQVSAYPGVRQALTTQQRRIGKRGNIVMVGRDIGTVVLPEADLKIYLDASVEERARRRYREIQEHGKQVDYRSVLISMRKRDKIDSTRDIAPLIPAEDAVVINTDLMTEKEVFDQILKMLYDDL